MLAEIDDGVLTEVLHQRGMPRFTEKTIVDPAALRCELARIRERGWAVDDEEHTVGMRCVAATIHNEHGEVIAGVSVSGPSVRETPAITSPCSLWRSEEHTSELQSLMRISYAVFCWQTNNSLDATPAGLPRSTQDTHYFCALPSRE